MSDASPAWRETSLDSVSNRERPSRAPFACDLQRTDPLTSPDPRTDRRGGRSLPRGRLPRPRGLSPSRIFRGPDRACDPACVRADAPDANGGYAAATCRSTKNSDRPPQAEPPHSRPRGRDRTQSVLSLRISEFRAETRQSRADFRARLSNAQQPAAGNRPRSRERRVALRSSQKERPPDDPSIVCLGDIDGSAQLSWQDDQSGGRSLFIYGIQRQIPPKKCAHRREAAEPRPATHRVSQIGNPAVTACGPMS